MKQYKTLKVGIAGLGLIGGSLYKNLAINGGVDLFVCTRNENSIAKVQEDNFKASQDINILKNCEIIFVCTPISETVNMIKKVFEINPNAIIVDVASLKNDILKSAEKLPNCKFIGSHPMAGTENSGFNSSFPALFDEAVWVITPSKNVSQNDIELLKSIILVSGAKPVIMDAEEHDRAVAMISHLPMLLAQSLFLGAADDNNALMLASSGFRDTTRLAMTNKVLANDMLSMNKNNIKASLEMVINNAQKLLGHDFFEENIDMIISKRKNLYNSSGKNQFLK